MLARVRRYWRRKKYVPGKTLVGFLAPDIRREVEIVDAAELDAGFVTVRMRTWNVMYAAKGGPAMPELGPPRRIAIADLWTWTGAPWGGPVPSDD